MSTKKYFIDAHSQKQVVHGGICNLDIQKVLLEQGFEAIESPFFYDFSLRAKWGRFLYMLKMWWSIPPGSVVFFQFPMTARMQRSLLWLISTRKRIDIICFVADIDGMRTGNETLYKKELKTLNRYRYFIVHNPSMQGWLNRVLPGKQSTILEFFDYFPVPSNHNPGRTNTVVFAGNLHKSTFVQQLQNWHRANPNTRLHIYGEGWEPTGTLHNVDWKGVFQPYEIPGKITGSWGLVWDGTKADQLSGSMGTYLMVNTPHKLSLYIVCHLPIIAPEGSAAAALIQQYGIGITINNLMEIEQKINTISDPEYETMMNNCRKLAGEIKGGKFMATAINKMLSVIQEGK